jgi:hypothetical protein
MATAGGNGSRLTWCFVLCAHRPLLRPPLQSRGTGASAFKGWAPECSAAIGMPKRGFATSRGIPHGEFAWRSRLHPEVRSAFAAVFNEDPSDMAVGTDNIMWAGPEKSGATTNDEWLHVDQNTNNGLLKQCYQGAVILCPTLPRSHHPPTSCA